MTPLKLDIQDSCMPVSLLLNIYSAHTVPAKVKSVDTAVSIISLWHNTFPVQRCNNELVKIKLSISQWYSEETPYGDNKVETSVETNSQSLPATIFNCSITWYGVQPLVTNSVIHCSHFKFWLTATPLGWFYPAKSTVMGSYSYSYEGKLSFSSRTLMMIS